MTSFFATDISDTAKNVLLKQIADTASEMNATEIKELFAFSKSLSFHVIFDNLLSISFLRLSCSF